MTPKWSTIVYSSIILSCLLLSGHAAAQQEPTDFIDPVASDSTTQGESTARATTDMNPGEQTLSYPIVDTAQVNCYGDSDQITCPSPGESFYGQDAKYTGNPPSYTLSSDGLTVFDHVTGLTWTHSPDLNADGRIDTGDKLTFAQALAYPDSPSAEAWKPNGVEANSRMDTFWNLIQNDGTVDFDAEWAQMETDLEAIFNK